MRRCLTLCACLFLAGWMLAGIAHAKAVYWVDGGSIYRAEADGSDADRIFSGFAGHLAIDGKEGKVYFTGDLPIGAPIPSGRVWRMNLDGSGVEELVRQWAAPAGIALLPARGNVAAAKMLWADWGSIQAADRDGSRVEVLVEGMDGANGIALNVPDGKMYWTLAAGGQLTPVGRVPTVQRANLDGSMVETVADLSGPGSGIAVDAERGKLYFTYVNPNIDGVYAGFVMESDMDGSNPRAVVSSLYQPVGLAIDPEEGWLYWTDGGPGRMGKVQRARLDGSGLETIAEGNNLAGIALDLTVPEPGGLTLLALGAITLLRSPRCGRRSRPDRT